MAVAMGPMALLVLIVLFFIVGLVVSIINRIARKVFGSLYLLIGGVGIIFGIIRYNSAEVQLARVFGATDKVSTFCIAAGIVLAVLGIIFLCVGRSRTVMVNSPGMNPQFNPNMGGWQPAPGPAPAQTVEVTRIRCMSCKALNDENAAFCGSCGAPLK